MVFLGEKDEDVLNVDFGVVLSVREELVLTAGYGEEEEKMEGARSREGS